MSKKIFNPGALGTQQQIAMTLYNEGVNVLGEGLYYADQVAKGKGEFAGSCRCEDRTDTKLDVNLTGDRHCVVTQIANQNLIRHSASTNLTVTSVKHLNKKPMTTTVSTLSLEKGVLSFQVKQVNNLCKAAQDEIITQANLSKGIIHVGSADAVQNGLYEMGSSIVTVGEDMIENRGKALETAHKKSQISDTVKRIAPYALVAVAALAVAAKAFIDKEK